MSQPTLGDPTPAEYFFWWAAAMVAASGILAVLFEYGVDLLGVAHG